MNNKLIRKITGTIIATVAVIGVSVVASAAQPNMTVYITDSGSCYHLDGCSQIKKTKIPMMLSDTVGKFDPCTVCNAPSNADVDPNVIAEPESVTTPAVTETTEIVDGNEVSGAIEVGGEENQDSVDVVTGGNSNDLVSDTTDSSEIADSSEIERPTPVNNSNSEIANDDEIEYYLGGKSKTSNSNTSNSNSSTTSGNSNSKNTTTTTTSSGSSKNSNTTNSSKSKTTTSNSKTTSSGSSKSTTTPSGKELMSQKQRRAKYLSKTNPKRGEKPVTTPKPASNGYMYADFATFNGYNSDNNLGGTPIYLLGTVMDIVPFYENTNPATGAKQYRVGILVNDSDGYQWYMRAYVAKDKLDALKTTMLGQAGYIYGGFAGYSGVMNRPMMDATIFINSNGTATDMSIFI